jgi:transcriptional regulator with XRE-family HTH domain
MTINPQQFRAARAFLGWSQRDLAAKARVSRATITNFELGISQPQARVLEALVETLECEGIVFTSAVEGVYDPGVTFKWGMTPPLAAPSEGTPLDRRDEGAAEAAGWDDLSVPAEIEQLRSYWRDRPREWAALSEIGRHTLSEKMFGSPEAGDALFGA